MNSGYAVTTQDTTTIVNVSGDFDASRRGVFASVSALLSRPPEWLVISLDGCTSCDASALTMLVRANEAMKAAFAVVLPKNARCRRVFEVTGLTKSFAQPRHLRLRLDYERYRSFNEKQFAFGAPTFAVCGASYDARNDGFVCSAHTR